MKLKTFYATDMPEALRQIKAELGPEALIVQSRKVRRGGLRGYFQKPLLEVQAAIESAQKESTLMPRGASEFITRTSSPSPASGLGKDFTALDLKTDMDELKAAINRLARQNQTGKVFQSPVLSAIYQHLLGQELEEEFAQSLVLAVSEELSPQAAKDIRTVRDSIVRHLSYRLNTKGPIVTTPGKPKTVFLIGPTGVGKTTTIAKLAAEFALIQKKQVVLVTTDTYRIAAIPQLETYAKIIGIPIEVVYRPDELSHVIAKHVDKDLILIDTPGRSQRNTASIEELKGFIDFIPEKEVFLSISSATKYKDMIDISERFGVIPYDGLLVTKLDETECFGPVYSLLDQTRKPLTYVTNGQNVPHDIEVGAPERLAALAFQNRLEGASW